MADDGEHSLFSASGFSGWSVCSAKPVLEAGRRTSSEYADEGTAAHDIAARVLQARIDGEDVTAARWLGEKVTVHRDGGPARTFTVDAEMVEHVDTYVDACFVRANLKGSERMCERRVHYHRFLGVSKELAFGTGDFIAIVWGGCADGRDLLLVDDFKYGAGVTVDAEDNGQMRLYGLGAYDMLSCVADIGEISMAIHQPRKDHFDEETLSIDELLAWAKQLPLQAQKVLEAKRLAEAHVGIEAKAKALHREGYINPSDKGCRFCDAVAICPAQRDQTRTSVSRRASADDFEDLTVDTPQDVAGYGHNYLTNAFARLGQIETWMHAIRREVANRVLTHGEAFEGVKVVQGKMGNRKWKDPGAVEAWARKKPGVMRELMFATVLKSPAQMEKALKTSPASWAEAQAFIVREQGKPAVVPIHDTRKSIGHKAMADQFDDETYDEEQPAAVRGAAVGSPEKHPFR